MGVKTMVAHLNGAPVDAVVDTGAALVTRENMDEESVRALLSPDLSSWLDE
jgi:ribose transport system substrate-binding protein